MGGYFTGLKHFTGISNIRYGRAKSVSIIKQPVGSVIEYTDNYTFEVVVKGTKPLTYQWFKNSAPISGEISPILKIQNASQNDSGSYFCVITNLAGSVRTNTVILTVLLPITITLQPSAVFVKNNQNAVFTIDYNGGGNPVPEWYYNNRSLLNFTKSLTVFNVTNADLGEYYCVVTNAKASVTSNKVNLDLIYPITITKDPENTKISPNGTLTLQCQISGAYPATFFWRKDGVAIPNTLTTLTDVNVLTCTYFEPIVNRSFVGDYDCVITNITNVSAISKIAKVVLDNSISLNSDSLNSLYITTNKNSNAINIAEKWYNLGQNAKNLSTGMRIYNPDINQILTNNGPEYSSTLQKQYILSSSIIESIFDDRNFNINTPSLSSGNSISKISSSVVIEQVQTTQNSDILTVSNSEYLFAGMTLIGPKIPTGAIITEIINSNSIRININCAENAITNDITAKIEPITKLRNAIIFNGSNLIRLETTVGVFLGMTIKTNLFPDNTYVTRINNDNTILVNNSALSDLFGGDVTVSSKKRLLASTILGSKNLIISSVDGLSIGMKVIGPNIPQNSFITSIKGSNEIEIYNAATATQYDVEVSIDPIITSILITTSTNSTTVSTINTSNLLACAKINSNGLANDTVISEVIDSTLFKINKFPISNTVNQVAEVSIPEESNITSISACIDPLDNNIIDVGCTVGIVAGTQINSDLLQQNTIITEIIDYSKVKINKTPVKCGSSTNVTTKLDNPLFIDGNLYKGVQIQKEVGDSIQFSIKPSSTNNLTYQWMKEGFGKIDFQENSIYYIQSLKTSDTGSYYVVIMDGFNYINSTVAPLRVTSNYIIFNDEEYIMFGDNLYWKI